MVGPQPESPVRKVPGTTELLLGKRISGGRWCVGVAPKNLWEQSEQPTKWTSWGNFRWKLREIERKVGFFRRLEFFPQRTAAKFNFSLHLHNISYFLYVTYINFFHINTSATSPTSLLYPLHHLHTSSTSTSSTSHTLSHILYITYIHLHQLHLRRIHQLHHPHQLHLQLQVLNVYISPTKLLQCHLHRGIQGLLHKRSQEFLHRSCYTVGVVQELLHGRCYTGVRFQVTCIWTPTKLLLLKYYILSLGGEGRPCPSKRDPLRTSCVSDARTCGELMWNSHFLCPATALCGDWAGRTHKGVVRCEFCGSWHRPVTRNECQKLR